ncbi:ArsR/SmtB family transcription factor [Ilumatobacter sp.]|uniref:ArsR/SmtB family transcription factor n=1 Tax=Ilumatobacter sp. TaxID=1967498 RepID=UPI003B519BC3
MDADESIVMAGRVSALADPVRLRILSILAGSDDGEVCACDFVEPLGRSQPTVSHHLRVLAEAGFVEGDKRGRWVWYRLRDDSVADLARDLVTVATGGR